VGIEAPQGFESAVTETQALVRAADRNRRRHPVKGRGMAFDVAAQFGFRLIERGNVDRKPGNTMRQALLDHLYGAPLARHDRMRALGGARPVEQAAAQAGAHFLVQKFELAGNGFLGRGGIDRARISLVDPDKCITLIAAPGRKGRCHDMFLEARTSSLGLAQPLHQAAHLGALAGDVPEPEHGKRARRTPLGLEGAAIERLHDERKARAARAQTLHGRIETSGILGFEAREQIGKIEIARGRVNERRRRADDARARLKGTGRGAQGFGRPDEDSVRFGGKDRFGGMKTRLKCGKLLLTGKRGAAGGTRRTQARHSGDNPGKGDPGGNQIKARRRFDAGRRRQADRGHRFRQGFRQGFGQAPGGPGRRGGQKNGGKRSMPAPPCASPRHRLTPVRHRPPLASQTAWQITPQASDTTPGLELG